MRLNSALSALSLLVAGSLFSFGLGCKKKQTPAQSARRGDLRADVFRSVTDNPGEGATRRIRHPRSAIRIFLGSVTDVLSAHGDRERSSRDDDVGLVQGSRRPLVAP